MGSRLSNQAFIVSPAGQYGNKNTDHGGGSCTHTLQENNHWWAVDLHQNRLVGEVHLTEETVVVS